MIHWLEKAAAAAQHLLPHHFLSALIYRFMRIETRWIKNLQIRIISKMVSVDWSEASSENLEDYPHFNAFFTRDLKDGVRTFQADEKLLISPCDGRISELGPIDENRIFQAKGRSYTLDSLLANDPGCGQWLNGYFYTIYLSPRDYHKVHMPLSGSLNRMIHVPGRLFSVAPYTVRHVPGLFARNERVISVFDTQYGPVAQILVGAMLVSSMATTWEGEITPTKSRTISTKHYQDRDIRFSRGQEMGRFNMGSTVILLLPPGAVSQNPGLGAGDKVQLGQKLAVMKS